MNILITICARGGSKGIPGKNIRPLAGRPLIVYSIRHAQSFAEQHGADIALSTDDAAITHVAAEHGLSTDYVRPAKLATDRAGKLPVIRDLLLHEERLQGKTYDLVLDLDVTSPMRTVEDLEAAMRMLLDRSDALNLFSVNPARRHPSFNMVEESPGGFVQLVRAPAVQVESRQAAPPVFDLNASFYFYRRAFFEQEPLLLVQKSLTYIMPHACFDLDEPVDFEFLEYLLKKKKLDFGL